MPNPRSRRKKTPLIVHLGNVGFSADVRKTVGKTARYAMRFPNFRFVGIDREKTAVSGLQQKLGIRNWVQWNKSFRHGLARLKDNSVSLISSELAVGHYTSKGKEMVSGFLKPQTQQHTLETLRMAYRKLRPGGKIFLVLGKNSHPVTLACLKKAGFLVQEDRHLLSHEFSRTESLASLKYPQSEQSIEGFFPLWQIIATKPKK